MVGNWGPEAAEEGGGLRIGESASSVEEVPQSGGGGGSLVLLGLRGLGGGARVVKDSLDAKEITAVGRRGGGG